MSLFVRTFHLAHFIFPEGGTCLEFGVASGGTYLWQVSQITKRYSHSRLIGFDSWKGLPEESSGVWCPERHARGKFSFPKDTVQRRIPTGDSRFRLVDGFFCDSLTAEVRDSIGNLIFVNIDVDLYKSTLEVLEFIEPLLREGVLIYWDDWKDPNDFNSEPWGEHKAWDEWYSKRSNLGVEIMEVNPVNQRSMIVTEVNGRKIDPNYLSKVRYKCLSMM